MKKSSRRSFFNSLTKGISVVGISLMLPFKGRASNTFTENETETWLTKIKGTHKMIFDATTVNNGVHSIWTWAFMDANNQSEIADDDMTALVVFRHLGIGLGLQDWVWKKYKLGKFFSVMDIESNTPADRNPYWDPKEGLMPNAGMSIKKLMERGVMFCACKKAIANHSKQIATKYGYDPVEVMNDMMKGLLPGVQPVSAGVLVVQRAQQRGCAYCFAG